MRKTYLLYLAISSGLFFYGCQEPATRKDFFASSEQILKVRNVAGTIAPGDSVSLSSVGADYVSQFRVRDGAVYFGGLGTTVRVLKDAFQSPSLDSIVIAEGRGPGEITRISDFDLHGNHLLVMDYSQYKIVVYSLRDKSYIREIRWPEIRALKFCALTDTSAVILNGYEPQRFINIVANDSIYSSFGEVLISEGGTFNPLTLEGKLECGANGIFFGGYSEPVLARYEPYGSRQFAVKTIEPVNASQNYLTSNQAGGAVFRFTPEALFSTLDMALNGDHLVTVPHPNGNTTISLLDVYDAASGEYKHSSRVELGGIYLLDADGSFLYGVRADALSEYWIYRFELK